MLAFDLSMAPTPESLDERRTALSELNAGVGACRACALGSSRTRAVPGEGPADAEIMFIGEGPGYYEDQQGRPFVGAAGQFLEELLASVGLRRTDVFIANVIKCRPPGNRDPLPEEIGACSGWLSRQLAIVQPKPIVTLGRYSPARLPARPPPRRHSDEAPLGVRWLDDRERLHSLLIPSGCSAFENRGVGGTPPIPSVRGLRPLYPRCAARSEGKAWLTLQSCASYPSAASARSARTCSSSS